jgi:hypothetical protein
MPRYYFNVECKTFATPDLVGLEMANDDAARTEAYRLLNNVLTTSSLGPPPHLEKLWIEVIDQERRLIMLLPAK